MKTSARITFAASLFLLPILPVTQAATGTLTSLASDAQADQLNGVNSVSNGSTTFCSVGGYNNTQQSVVLVFQIPSDIIADTPQQFTAATLTTRLGTTINPANQVNADLYGLGYSSSSSVLAGDFYYGALDTTKTLIQDNFYTPATADYAVVSTSNAALINHLNAALAAARGAGATNAYVKFRLNADVFVYWARYLVGMNESPSSKPTLSYTTASVAGWKSVPLGGGGYVTGIVSNATGSAIYCRTDVGGAFRWAPAADGNNGSWVSISDDMVPYGTANAAGLMNVEGIAADPSNPNRVYIATGGRIYCSDDQGENWTSVSTTWFQMAGNGPNRADGERLAVDPNDPNIVWYGSIGNGLQKGVKSGSTWTWTSLPSTTLPFGAASAGISFVVCDKNGGTTILYAGVKGTTAGGVYRSTDGGTSWAPVGGSALTSPERAQISSNGTLYVTGGSGGVGKVLRGGTLTLITSLPATNTTTKYHAVAVDPNDATGNTVYVSVWDKRIWRSINGGTSWTMQENTFNEGPLTATNHVRQEPDGLRSLLGYWFGSMASMMINPANSNELWVSDFFGATRTRNAQALGTNPGSWWYTLQKNQEETVVLSLKSAPSGTKLMVGLSDVGGARYNDVTVRPIGAAGGLISGNANITSLDFVESNPNLWARTMVEPDGNGGNGSFSLDGGVNWTSFGHINSRTITNSATAGWEVFDVSPFLKKQKADGATTVTFAVRASTSATNQTMLRFSSREGANPPQLVVNGGAPVTPLADAMVYKGSQTNNYGVSSELQAQNYYDQDSYTRWFYVKFSLGSVSDITTASLRLYRAAAADTTWFSTTIQAIPSTTNWVEGDGGTDGVPTGEITWTNKPTNFYAVPGALSTSGSAGGGRIAISATDPSRMVWVPIGVGTAVHYTKDRGVTWAASTGAPASTISGIYTNGGTLGKSGQNLAADRANGKFYYAAFGGGSHIIYSSTNGETWTQAGSVNNGNSYNMRTPQLMAAPVSPTCPTGGDIWLCDDGTYNGQGGGLWRSVNSGTNWSAISGIGKVGAVGFGKSQNGVGYCVYIYGYKGSVKGIFRSDDYGVTWTQLLSPSIVEILAVAGDRQNYNSVFIGTDGRGVFRY